MAGGVSERPTATFGWRKYGNPRHCKEARRKKKGWIGTRESGSMFPWVGGYRNVRNAHHCPSLPGFPAGSYGHNHVPAVSIRSDGKKGRKRAAPSTQLLNTSLLLTSSFLHQAPYYTLFSLAYQTFNFNKLFDTTWLPQ